MKINQILTLLLALVMLFALTACGESKSAGDSALKESIENAAKEAAASDSGAESAPASEPASEPEPAPEPTPEPTLVGTWKCEKDMREMVAGELAADPESAKFFNDYLESFTMYLTLELREDGSFSLQPDLSPAKEQMLTAMRAYLQDAAKAQGVSFTDDQLDQYAQLTADQMDIDIEAVSGSYSEENGILTLGDGGPVPYVLSGDTLEFTVEEFGDLSFSRVG